VAVCAFIIHLFSARTIKRKGKGAGKKVENPHQKRQERKRRKEEKKSKVLASFESH
jgi:hypothetical protein